MNNINELREAIINKDIQKAKQLIDEGIDINDMQTINLLNDAVKSENYEMVQLLLAAGIDPNSEKLFTNPLYEASFQDYTENTLKIVKLLLKYNTNPNKVETMKLPLVAAADSIKKKEILKLLIKHGADPNIQDPYNGEAPLCEVSEPATIEILINAGANIDIEDNLGNTPLLKAAKYESTEDEKFELLIKHKASVTHKNRMGNSALHYVAAHHSSINPKIEKLIEAGSNINEQNFYGYTPLHIAIANTPRTRMLIPFLIEKDADPEIKNVFNENAMDIAISQNSKETIQQLRELGIKKSTNTKPFFIKSKESFMENLTLPPTLVKYQDKITSTLKPYIRIILEKGKKLDLWSSRILGNPYMTKKENYPKDKNGKYLQFLAQINFEETPNIENFPKKGLLQFFIGDDYIMNSSYKVIFYEEIPTKKSEELIKDFTFLPAFKSPTEYGVNRPFALKFELNYAPISPYSFDFKKTLNGDINITRSFDGLFREQERIFHSAESKIGGYPFFTQDDVRYIYYSYDDNKGHGDHKNKDILLFQLNSSKEICIGDAGVINFFMSSEELSNLDFSDVIYSWDCH